MDVEKVKEEINERKIRRFTDAQIVQAAYDSGKVIISDLKLSSTSCNDRIEISNDLVQECIIICDSTNLTNKKEQQVWEAYQYNFANELPLKDNIQKSNDTSILYTKPLSSNNQVKSDSLDTLKVIFLRIKKKELILSM